MAKRKRLTPVPSLVPDRSEAAVLPGAGRAPIAQVAGAAAAAAAFHDLAEEMTLAREEGRLLLTLPLDAVQSEHLVRDRMAIDTEDMATLKASLRARGQQTPIEVEALSEGGYGLISGWRRLAALRALLSETGEPQFATVQAILRRPETGAAAYVAMVEENEIRSDLSFFERARIVRRSVQGGAFDSDQESLNVLFASAPAARRSKIKSFLRVVDDLEDILRHPTRLSEHLGLRLSKALATQNDLPRRIEQTLDGVDPQDADAEISALQTVLSEAAKATVRTSETDTVSASSSAFRTVAQGVSMKHDGQTLTLKGGRVTPELVALLEKFLREID